MQKQIVEKMEAGESRRIISPGSRMRRRKKPRTRTSSKERTREESHGESQKGRGGKTTTKQSSPPLQASGFTATPATRSTNIVRFTSL